MSKMRDLRTKKDLKQVDIARATGLSKASISLYENNKNRPSLSSAFKIAQVLGATVDELFSETTELTKERR